MLLALPLPVRAVLAFDHLVLMNERKQAKYGFGITDSDVLDVIDLWYTPCGHADDDACADDCDRRMLGAVVWDAVEAQQEQA